LKDEPPGILLSEERASDVLPVLLGVLRAGDGKVLGLAADRPAGFGDPDGLSTSALLGLVESVEEKLLGVLDAVGHGVLEVWVGVHSDKVRGIDDGLVAVVDIDGPCVDVSYGRGAQWSTLESIPNLVDILGDNIRAGTDTSVRLDTNLRDTVEILTTHRDTSNTLREVIAVCGDGGFDGSDLVLDDCFTSRSPETEKDRHILLYGGRDSRDWSIGGSVLDGCEKAHAGEGGARTSELLRS